MAFCTNCGNSVDSAATQFCPRCGTRLGAPPSPVPHVSAAPTPAAPATPKKRGPIIWILAGCLGLIVIGAVIVVSTGVFVAYKAKQAGFDPALMQSNPSLAVAKMLASANPDLEVVDVDDSRGIIRVREKKTGKTLTMDLEDAKNGKFVFIDDQNRKVELHATGEGENASVELRSPDGTVRMGAGQLPDWIPSYSNAEGAGTFGVTAKEGGAGTYHFQTKDAPEDVISFYEQELQNSGFQVERIAGQAGQTGSVGLSATDGNTHRKARVIGLVEREMTTVTVWFESGK